MDVEMKRRLARCTSRLSTMVIYKPHAAAPGDRRYCSSPRLVTVNILWAGALKNQIKPSHFHVITRAICVIHKRQTGII